MKNNGSVFNPYQNTGAIWIFDFTRNALIENRPDGIRITHISPSGFKFTLPIIKSQLSNLSRF